MQMEPTVLLLLATLTCIAAQYNPLGLNPLGINPLGMNSLGINSLGMNSLTGNPYHMWGVGSQMHNTGLRPIAHAGYPWMSATWRAHPGFRMAAGEKAPGMNSPATAAAVVNVPKVSPTEEILTHMVIANQNVKPYVEHIADVLYNQEPPKARQAMVPPVSFVNGMNPVRNNAGMMDDCTPQDVARWNREIMEWVY